MGSTHWRDQVNAQASVPDILWKCNCGQVQLPGRLAGAHQEEKGAWIVGWDLGGERALDEGESKARRANESRWFSRVSVSAPKKLWEYGASKKVSAPAHHPQKKKTLVVRPVSRRAPAS